MADLLGGVCITFADCVGTYIGVFEYASSDRMAVRSCDIRMCLAVLLAVRLANVSVVCTTHNTACHFGNRYVFLLHTARPTSICKISEPAVINSCATPALSLVIPAAGHFSYATMNTVMTRKKKSKRSNRKTNANRKLAALFKMSREELATRKTTGAGVHQTDPRHAPRGEQKRRAINDQLDR